MSESYLGNKNLVIVMKIAAACATVSAISVRINFSDKSIFPKPPHTEWLTSGLWISFLILSMIPAKSNGLLRHKVAPACSA